MRSFYILTVGLLIATSFVAPRLAAQCEDCYECNTSVGGLGSLAECCSGARCEALANDDLCTQAKNDIQDCSTSSSWLQPQFEYCVGSAPCSAGGGGGGTGGGSGGGSCAYQPGGFCPASCSSCSGSPGGPYWY